MTIGIVIPVHNEAAFIGKTLTSLLSQTYAADQIIVVDDSSTDGSADIIRAFQNKHKKVKYLFNKSESIHKPGGKVVDAFLSGYNSMDKDYDIICKFDADLEFPSNYLESIVNQYKDNDRLGMVGGVCLVEKNGSWIKESVTGDDHIRGALKSYRKECYKELGGLIPAFGWDTLDEMLAEYHGWSFLADQSLQVKHLKPTATRYDPASGITQGRAFFTMRLGFLLSVIRGSIQAIRKQKPTWFRQVLKGYYDAKHQKLPFLVSPEVGQFIRKRQWRSIRNAIFKR